MNTYTAGQIINLAATCTTNTGTPVDPGTITLKYQITTWAGAAQPTVTVTYTGTSTPTVGQIARTAVGEYTALIDTTNLPGVWTVEWQTTGVGQAVAVTVGNVEPAPL